MAAAIRRAFVRSFGCRASQADGAALESSLRSSGIEVVPGPEQADLIVLNTCTVTHSADVDARRIIRGTHRDFPNAEILVTGCYAQRAPDELRAMDGVRWVVGNSHKAAIAELAAEPYHGQILHAPFEREARFSAAVLTEIGRDRTRPNLKIQDGCNNRCSFCIIPGVRGPSRSADANAVVAQIAQLAGQYREIVLTGINLGRWGRDLPGRPRFPALLKTILEQTSIARLRISSVEPMDWTDELIGLFASSERIARHVHMPLQSGSDSVLKRMSRRYRIRHYQHRLSEITRHLPGVTIGADVMTGFPGETESEFAETVQFVESQPFSYLHVFTYSERPGTAAESMRDPVPVATRRIRTEQLRALSARKWHEHGRQFVGRTLSAVTLEEPGVALTSNYLRVRMQQVRAPQQLVELSVGSSDGDMLYERSLLPVMPN